MPQQKDAAWWREYRARRKAQTANALDANTALDLAIAEGKPEIVRVPNLGDAPLDPALHAKPSFLAAPDDDCVCGHDRHAYHLGGGCNAYVGRRRCPCPGFMADLGFG